MNKQITIFDLARECTCDPATIRKWIKKNSVSTDKCKAANGKSVKCLSLEDADKFRNYWTLELIMPDDMITIAEVASRNNVDRKTVRLWCMKNKIEIRPLKCIFGPPMGMIKNESGIRFDLEYGTNGRVPVSYFLAEYNTDLRTIKRWAEANAYEFLKMPSENGGRANLALNKEDAKALHEHLKVVKLDGFFYMLRPVPELDPNRIKLGFSRRPSVRLKEHMRVCPYAEMLGYWKCKKTDEAKIRRAVTKTECNILYTEHNGVKHATEVFTCTDYTLVLQRLKDFFNE